MKKYFSIIILCFIGFLSNKISAQVTFETYNYSGTVGGNAVIMNFYANECAGCTVTGDYHYTKYNKKIDLTANSSEQIVEQVSGKNTGYFIFQGANGNPANYDFPEKLIGKWYSMDGTKSFDVVLNLIK